MTTDIDTDDGIRCEKVSHSRSHTVSDTELDCELARLKKRKVYQKKKGQSHTANTTCRQYYYHGISITNC